MQNLREWILNEEFLLYFLQRGTGSVTLCLCSRILNKSCSKTVSTLTGKNYLLVGSNSFKSKSLLFSGM